MKDAAIMVLTHIVASALPTTPIKGRIEESEAIAGVVFLCAAGSQLILYINREGIELPLNETIARAGLVVYQFLDPDDVDAIISRGMGRYKEMILDGRFKDGVHEYIGNLSKIVLAYLVSKDESIISAFQGLYDLQGRLMGKMAPAQR